MNSGSLLSVSVLQMFSQKRGTCLFFFSASVPRSAPKNLRVSEEWYNRFRISWDAPPTPTKGYRVVYQPLSGDSALSCPHNTRTWWSF